MTGGDPGRVMHDGPRELIEAAMEELANEGRVVSNPVEYRGQEGGRHTMNQGGQTC